MRRGILALMLAVPVRLRCDRQRLHADDTPRYWQQWGPEREHCAQRRQHDDARGAQGGGYTIVKNLELYLEADYIYIKNPGNISTNAPIHDLQLTAGISYSL